MNQLSRLTQGQKSSVEHIDIKSKIKTQEKCTHSYTKDKLIYKYIHKTKII